MQPPAGGPKRFTTTEWLILTVASIGFLFDTYELLLLPLIAAPAIAEILQVPANNPLVTTWVGRMLWLAALSGGVFGLLGGWLTDRLGRKTVLALSIALYSLSPAAAALSTSLTWFLVFRCATFVGVCIEFVAAITWLAELFPDRGRRERVLGWTQAFASLGGLFVTLVHGWILKNAALMPALPLPEPFNGHADWRYTLLTGLLPAIPIALLLPFVPESKVWREKRLAGTLRRPSFAELFAPALRRTTLVTAALSACAYGIAFGALQLTPTRIAPGLPDLAGQQEILSPLQAEAVQLNQQLNGIGPRFEQACREVPGLRELSGKRAKVRVGLRANRTALDAPSTPEARKLGLQTVLNNLTNQLTALDAELARLTGSQPEARKALLEREKTMGQLAGNRERQTPADKIVKARGTGIQFWQELGGLLGRIALALLVVLPLRKGTLLRIFQLPGLLILPLTYVWLFRSHPDWFPAGVFIVGFLTVAQFSYFGEYLPKVFPLHLRGTGGSFATNVGGRMFGTSAAFVTTNWVAPLFGGQGPWHVATAAALVGTAVFALGLLLSFLLLEPKAEAGQE